MLEAKDLFRNFSESFLLIGPLHDLVTWYGLNYARTQKMQWDFENKGTLTSQARLSIVLKVPLHICIPVDFAKGLLGTITEGPPLGAIFGRSCNDPKERASSQCH